MANSNPTLNGLDLTTLRLLLAAVEEGNLGRAAERESIAVSSISRRITDLEARLGVTLLHRHDRGVTLTTAGEEAIPRIRDVMGLLEHVVKDLAEYAAGVRGVIRLRTHLTALVGPLPKLLRSFLDKHPGLEIEVEDASSFEVMHAIRVGTADVGLVSGTVSSDDLEFLPWATDEVAVILPAGHPLAVRSEIRLYDLLVYPFIAMQRDSALLAIYRREAALIGGTLQERARVTGFEMVRNLVAQGLGVSILPSAAAIGDERIVVRPLAEQWARRPLMICVRCLIDSNAATRLLVSHLQGGNNR